MKYVSTRDGKTEVTASQAILRGISPDGGLYTPTVLNTIDFDLCQLASMDYRSLAYKILRVFLDDYTDEEIKLAVNSAYDEKFDSELIAPLVNVNGNYFLELFHGKTLAFKDMALSILPYLLTIAAKKNGVTEQIVILTATSGDTGKAALAGFEDVEGTKIIVFYPKDGVSEVQRLQMVTQTGKNTCVVAVDGNFDDTQTGVKEIFTDITFNEQLKNAGYIFSSANSINVGRFVPQIAYYFYAYGQLVKSNEIKCGDKINFTVPTGNFGNILAGWYAKQLGLPIDKLICASNDNTVLYDFFETGSYDINREFILTVSPSMDILISSNLERLLYHLSSDSKKICSLMGELKQNGKYQFEIDCNDITGEYAYEDETLAAIKEMYDNGYIMDTHTAVAYRALKKYRQRTGDVTPNVIVSTASPFKFTEAVHLAIAGEKSLNAEQSIKWLRQENGGVIPKQINDILEREVLHKNVCGKDGMKDFVASYLGLR